MGDARERKTRLGRYGAFPRHVIFRRRSGRPFLSPSSGGPSRPRRLGNKVYVIGGLTEAGESVRKVEILDLATGKWSHGPDFPGTERVGFSPAATVVDGKLILSTSDRAIHVLNEKGTGWEKVGTTVESRLVHRLVPGGADMVVALLGRAARMVRMIG